MAMLLLLSVLVTCLSYHGTSAHTGCIISKGGLDNFYQSSKAPLQAGLEVNLKALRALTVPEHFIRLTIAAVAVANVELTMTPALGFQVSVCLVIRLHCTTVTLLRVTLIVNVCISVQLKVVGLKLVIDDCNSVFGDIVLDVLSISIQVPRTALIAVLREPLCGAHVAACKKLNFQLLVDLALVPLPTGCKYDALSPRVTASFLELPFAASCTGVSKPPSPVLSCGQSYPGVLDDNFVHYISMDDWTCFLTALLKAKVLDREFTPEGMTTTTILESFPQVSCPRGLPVVVQFVCTVIRAEIRPSGTTFIFTFVATIGYIPPGGQFLRLLRFVMSGTVGIEITINCPRRLLQVSVTAISSFSIVGSCGTGPCDLDIPEAERVFQMRSWCKDILSVNLKERFHVLLPTHVSCNSCTPSVYREGCAYISCKPVIVW